MASDEGKIQNRGFCAKCNKIVPAHHEDRDGHVFLVKECPACGVTEAMVSTDAARYREKRRIADYQGDAQKTCGLNCTQCRNHKNPNLVFIDVTNRCNMNCPICLANIPAMGFRFDPPMAYFDKIFKRLSEMPEKPKIQLFGGEPTVRKDLVEMIRLAKEKYGLSARVVTNGLKLADEMYCKQLLATGTELMFSFDGRDARIYEGMRKHPAAFEKKMKALENVRKNRKSKITIMCCVGDINEGYMADTVEFCHEGRDYIAALDLIPLTAEWGPEEVDVKSTTIEGVEEIMRRAVPGLEFVPAGMLYHLDTLRKTFDVGRLTFGGAHPNCEVVSALISDGRHYYPLSRYLTRSFQDIIVEAVDLDREMGKRLESSLLARLLGHKGRQIVYGWALWKLIRRSVNMRELFGGSATTKLFRVFMGMLKGLKLKTLLRANTQCHGVLRLIILPFEEKECVESARLADCPAAFAFEEPKSKEIRFMPVCAWPAYKNEVLRLTTEAYGLDGAVGDEGLTGLRSRTEAQVAVESIAKE